MVAALLGVAIALAAAPSAPAEVGAALAVGDCRPLLQAEVRADDVAGLMARAGCGDAPPLERALPTLSGPLVPYARLLLARGLVGSEPARAEALLAGVTLPGDAGREVLLVRGRALVALKRSLEAREGLRALLSTPHGGEARYLLAVGAVDRGDVPAAVNTLRTLWSQRVDSPWADDAARLLATLGHPVPDFATQEGRQEALGRARSLVKASRAGEALDLYARLQPGPGTEAWKAEVAMARFAARDYAGAVVGLDALANPSPQQWFDRALARSRSGDPAGAAADYAALLAARPDTAQAEEASWKLGYLKIDQRAWADAIPLLEAHLARFPGSRFAADARWYIGWSHMQLQRPEQALVALDELVARHAASPLAAGGLYWAARLRGQGGDAAAERAGLEEVLRRFPVSGYAWFAAERLGRTFPAPPEAPPATIPQAFRDAHPVIALADDLQRAGQGGWARDVAGPVAADAAAAGRATALAVGAWLVDLGDVARAQELARPYCGSPQSTDLVAARVCWPRPVERVVRHAAGAAGLHPLLPYAIMTAESGLKPWVTSPAGARGLMQLMPELGQKLHEVLGLPGPYDVARLYSAPYNALLGTTELGRLQARFAGSGVATSLPLVIAGYNGGPEAVERWLAAYPTPPESDVFAEEIGYTETRRYVRRVLGYLMTYRWIYGDPR